MIRLRCPHCGVAAEETELSPGGAAHLARPGPEADDDAFEAYLFARDTMTMEVFGTYPADTGGPPDDVRDRMEAAR